MRRSFFFWVDFSQATFGLSLSGAPFQGVVRNIGLFSVTLTPQSLSLFFLGFPQERPGPFPEYPPSGVLLLLLRGGFVVFLPHWAFLEFLRILFGFPSLSFRPGTLLMSVLCFLTGPVADYPPGGVLYFFWQPFFPGFPPDLSQFWPSPSPLTWTFCSSFTTHLSYCLFFWLFHFPFEPPAARVPAVDVCDSPGFFFSFPRMPFFLRHHRDRGFFSCLPNECWHAFFPSVRLNFHDSPVDF